MHDAYAKNSPAAMARIVTLMLVSDAEIGDGEIESLDTLDVYRRLGIGRGEFAQVVADYFKELRAHAAPGGRLPLVDRVRLDESLGLIDDPLLRIEVARLLVDVAGADGRMAASELTVLGYILDRWSLSLDDLRMPLAA